MKIKTSELSGRALDLAVFVAEGKSYWLRQHAKWDMHHGYTDWVLDTDGALKRFRFDESYSRAGAWRPEEFFAPSVEWDQGGPIIDRERITLRVSTMPGLDWAAFYDVPGEYHAKIREKGATALIAAMRCFVAKKLGDEVEIPWEA